MKLQLAVDRLTFAQLDEIVEECKACVDVIEVGTSFIKEYGVSCVKKIKEKYPEITLLADIKTIDEAQYEFFMYYEAGADILTVMGSASLDTIRIARQEAKRYGKAYCIDLMELDEERVKALTIFDDAIFCIHVAKDCGVGISTQLQKVRSLLPENVCCAAAGSITLSDVASLKEAGISFMIVGSAIIHADDRKAAALRFKEVGRS